jgi:hypothetical protein
VSDTNEATVRAGRVVRAPVVKQLIDERRVWPDRRGFNESPAIEEVSTVE